MHNPCIAPRVNPVWRFAFRLTTFLISVLIISGFPADRAVSQGELVVTRNEIVLNFPNSLSFILEAEAPEPVSQVFLNYGTNSSGCQEISSRLEVDSTGSSQIESNWEWDFGQSGSIPPGAKIWWEWEVVLSGGETLRTEQQTFPYEDPRFTWNKIETERISIYWVDGDDSFGDQLMQISEDSLDRLENDLGIPFDSHIRLTIYPDTQSFQEAFLYISDWAGGLAFPEYNMLAIGLSPDMLFWAEDVIPHEIAHLVVNLKIFNCLGIQLPTWLSEGLSVAAEGPLPDDDYEELLEELEEGTLPGLATLASGFSANSGEARLSYTQSGAVVLFLIDAYGPEKLNELLSVMQSGKNVNPALLEVYGLDISGIDQAWRASLGYGEPPVAGQATPSTVPTGIPTLALWTAASFNATPTPSPEATFTPIPPEVEPTLEPTQIPATTVPEERGVPLKCLGVSVGTFGGVIIFSSTRSRHASRKYKGLL